MEKIDTLEELKGKTIVNIKQDLDDLWITFSDGTFTILTMKDVTEGFGYTKQKIDISVYDPDETSEICLELGLINEEDHKKAVLKEDEDEKIRLKQREGLEKERIRELELKQFEVLKNKYK